MTNSSRANVSQRSAMLFDVRYATRADGAKTAYGALGSGPLLLFPPSIMSILEWVSESSGGPGFFGALAEHRTVVAYDRHGCGLSDRDRGDFTLADDLLHMEAVVQTVGAGRFDIVSTSNVTPAVAFTAKHPERVRRLVLCDPTRALRTPRFEAMLRLLETGETGREAWLQSLTGLAFPSGADEATIQGTARFLRTAASLEVLLGLLRNHPGQVESFLSQVKAPTLVLHRRGDGISSLEVHGKYFAGEIPNARLVPLDGNEHIPWAGDWRSMATQILNFLLDDEEELSLPYDLSRELQSCSLSQRELEVLRLLASGMSNPQIADELVISLHTVRRHVSNIFVKIGVTNRSAATSYAVRQRFI